MQKHLGLEYREIAADDNVRLFRTRRCGGIVVTKNRIISPDDSRKLEGCV